MHIPFSRFIRSQRNEEISRSYLLDIEAALDVRQSALGVRSRKREWFERIQGNQRSSLASVVDTLGHVVLPIPNENLFPICAPR